MQCAKNLSMTAREAERSWASQSLVQLLTASDSLSHLSAVSHLDLAWLSPFSDSFENYPQF